MHLLSNNARMDLGSVAPVDRRRMDRAAVPTRHCSAGAARSCPPMTRSTSRPPASSTPARHRAALPRRRAGVHGAGSAAVHAPRSCCTGPPTCTASPQAAATTVIVPAERAPEAVTPMVSYQCAIDAVAVALLPVLCAARGAPRPPARSRSSSSCWSPPPWPRAGRCRCPTTRAAAACGAPRTSPATTCSTACAPR